MRRYPMLVLAAIAEPILKPIVVTALAAAVLLYGSPPEVEVDPDQPEIVLRIALN